MSLVLDLASQNLLFRDARTANKFTDEPVTDEQIQAIYDLVKYGPTSMNQQPLRFVLVRTPEARERLVSHLAEGNQAKTQGAPLTAILAYDVDFHEELPRVFPHFPAARDMFAGDEDLRHGQARLNATLQVGYFLLGVRAAGLDAGPMTGFDAAAIDKEFFPDGRHHTLVVVNIGHIDDSGTFPRSPRLDYDEVVSVV